MPGVSIVLLSFRNLIFSMGIHVGGHALVIPRDRGHCLHLMWQESKVKRFECKSWLYTPH